MATTLIEVCARAGDTERAVRTYDAMRAAPAGSRMTPSVHAYTAAMRAAAEGGCWQRALDMWDDMGQAACRPTGAQMALIPRASCHVCSVPHAEACGVVRWTRLHMYQELPSPEQLQI